ncbi:hypothetical protein [Chondromyces crocatus]|uniref:VWFC domain-containing protein n=1 Tax=Chondromyces crocatus TaxID=52 RepID=A0A0K1E9E6_CHOCO|nr:hypothetical protein [Chondromyces crocatus]AKT37495.1 uncharacterized protein CMC5_016360 [Chondromyces crocatus]
MNAFSFSFLRSSLLALAVAAPAALTGCIIVSNDSGETCTYEGTTYEVGDSFPAGDGCNTCSCTENGNVACTLMGCEPVTCDNSGVPVGEAFPGPDSSSNCESTCYCTQAGEMVCSAPNCAPVCEYEGQAYPEGASFPAADGCNTCSCTADGSVACTEMACECNPETEWWRDYIGQSPAQCEVIDYACPENTEAFGNACGCGCEQSAECQETYNCMPPSDCNVEEIQAQCPYSQIVY